MATRAKKLPSGMWRANQYIGKNKEGKAIYKSFTASSKKEAEYAAASYMIELKSSQELEKKKESDILFKDALAKYIEIKSNVLSPSTILGYESLQRNAFKLLDDKFTLEITNADIQKCINFLAQDHTPKTVRNAHGLISAVLRVYNPAFTPQTTLPQKQKKEIVIPTTKEITICYNAVANTDMEIPFLFASQCGLRASEISGLTKSNVFKEGEIHITQARVAAKGGTALKQPKSFAGNRIIHCSPQLCALALQAEGEFVTSLTAKEISEKWKRIIARLDINRFTFHALRHYFASQALLQNIPQKYIAEMMGHGSQAMLDQVYQHTFPDAKREFSNRMIVLTNRLMQTKI